jgi:hypothetical protein
MVKKKNSRASDEPARDDDAPEPAPDESADLRRARRRNTIVASVFVGLSFAAIGFVTWHRPRDPGRVWVAAIEQRQRDRIDTKVTRCFGGVTAASIRAHLPEVRRGTLPTVLRGCRGGSLSEVMALPLAVAGEMSAAPGYAEQGRLRVWEAYGRLAMALRAYERAILAVPDGAAVPEPARDALASALDDVATDADAVRGALVDLRNVVEENASWY